jgi:hypothetical protein
MAFSLPTYGDVVVPPLPTQLAENPKCSAAKEASRLYREANAATARIGEVRQAANEATERLRTAEIAYNGELDRGVTAERNVKLEAKLAAELSEAKLAAEPGIHQRRHNAAVQAQRSAVQAYGDHLVVNATELIAELAPEAHDATEALAAARAKIQPEVERYAAVREAVQAIVRVVAQSRDEEVYWALPSTDTLPPLPAEETLAWHDRQYRPEVAEAAA